MHSQGCLMDDPYIDNTTERRMNDQTRKALELAREALTGCTDSLEYVNRLALGAVDFDVRYERISIAGKAIAAIDAALSAPAAPVAPVVSKADIRRVFLANGFTIKEGCDDLKPYVYAAAEALLALRPAPAAPVALTWYEGAPPFPQDQEWFIAETIYGDRVVLRSLDEGREHKHTYDFKTADGTYMLTRNIKRWMQFPDCEYLPPAEPAASVAQPLTDELESAIEALVNQCNTNAQAANWHQVIHAEAVLERLYRSRAPGIGQGGA